jgi:uncharacterized protein YneF (UPF0154 family)
MDKAIADAYRTINAADNNTAIQADRLRKLYDQVGEDPAVGERAINEMLESGPDAAARLTATAEAVVRRHGLKED